MALLLILSIKVSVFVYDNYSSHNNSIENISVIDFEDSETEEKEIEEHKKIVEALPKNKISASVLNRNRHNFSLEIDTSTYLEFTTPPPELNHL